MVTLHVRHYAFGIALPILMAAVAYLQTNATPAELASAQGQSAIMLQYVSLASTLAAGFLDMYKARNSSGTDPQPIVVASPDTVQPVSPSVKSDPVASAPIVNVHVNPQNPAPAASDFATAADPPVQAPANPKLTEDEIKAISSASSMYDVIKVVGVNDAQNGTQRWKDAWQLFQSLHGYKQAAASS